jgi:hypothetical protein
MCIWQDLTPLALSLLGLRQKLSYGLSIFGAILTLILSDLNEEIKEIF